MKDFKQIRNTLRLNNIQRFGLVRFALVLTVLCLSILWGANTMGAHAQTRCSGKSYDVVSGDTLSAIAEHFGLKWQDLAKQNELANPDLIFVGQQICLSNVAKSNPAPAPAPVQKTPVTTAPAAPVQTASTSIDGMIDQVFGAYAPGAKHVAMCESSMNPNATNPYAIGGSHAAGLFQILYPSTWNTTSQASQSPYNAQANIKAAYEIFQRDGYSWREWVCQP
ncbi:LysM peptidoglycan-binding domain-containing protein [Ktedonobacter racemifer]|uniref:LysM peptidoglycan-binding domain-containing protein n=1 Tax=Ktedonobacter racemifer TaxID=363277 RepID=UPI0002DA187C|nr:LysM peptidoglycan-binding domain-containing protein [Ktedonobacter racemifer]